MKVIFKKSFIKDLKNNSKNKKLLSQIKSVIEEIEDAQNINELKNLKKLKAEGSYYRIRVGNYRIGLIIKNNIITFVRLLHRKDIYRFFP